MEAKEPKMKLESPIDGRKVDVDVMPNASKKLVWNMTISVILRMKCLATEGMTAEQLIDAMLVAADNDVAEPGLTL